MPPTYTVQIRAMPNAQPIKPEPMNGAINFNMLRMLFCSSLSGSVLDPESKKKRKWVKRNGKASPSVFWTLTTTKKLVSANPNDNH